MGHIPSGMDIVSFFSCVHTHTHINMEHGKIYTDDRWIRAVNFFSFFFSSGALALPNGVHLRLVHGRLPQVC
jgi:hypothetical protein